MKKLLIIIVLLAGCATSPCPKEDMLIQSDGYWMRMEKGFFDDRGNDLMPEFRERLKEYLSDESDELDEKGGI